MKSYLPSLAMAAAVIVGAAAALAQWPSYRTPGPRSPEGKIDMTAPAPRTADGHPDFSGLWAAGGGGGGGGRGRGAAKGKGTAPAAENAKAPPAAPPRAPAPAASDSPPLATFFNIGQNIPGGTPMTPWATKVYNDRKSENSKDNPDAHCLPLGYMQLHLHPQPRKIIQTSKLMVILYEAQAGVRQIFLDGRPLPNNDPEPWWYGYSIGHWDGDTLVVESTGFRDDVLAGRERYSVDQHRQNNGALPPPEFRNTANRYNDRGPEGLHEAIHGSRESALDAGYGADRVYLQ